MVTFARISSVSRALRYLDRSGNSFRQGFRNKDQGLQHDMRTSPRTSRFHFMGRLHTRGCGEVKLARSLVVDQDERVETSYCSLLFRSVCSNLTGEQQRKISLAKAHKGNSIRREPWDPSSGVKCFHDTRLTRCEGCY